MAKTSNPLEMVLSTVLAVAAVVIAAAVVHREFRVPRGQEATESRGRPERIVQWDSAWRMSTVLGHADAPIKILEVVDLECRYCRRFHKLARALAAKHGSQLAIGYLHYPIETHRFAAAAARGVECAGLQGRFKEFVDIVLDRQDSLGLKSWTSYGSDAGVPDLPRLSECIAGQTPIPRIEQQFALGKELGIRATPTVVINGWRFPAPPDSVEVERVITAVRAGRQPF